MCRHRNVEHHQFVYLSVKRAVVSCNYQVTCTGLIVLQHYGSRVYTVEGRHSWPTPIRATFEKGEMSLAVVVATVSYPGWTYSDCKRKCFTMQLHCGPQRRIIVRVCCSFFYHLLPVSTPPRPRVQEKYDELYRELIYSSSDDSSSGDDGGPAFGLMHLTLTLGSFSLTTLSDDNPIDMFDFIANIGGFWGKCTPPAGQPYVSMYYFSWRQVRGEFHQIPGCLTDTLALRCCFHVLASQRSCS